MRKKNQTGGVVKLVAPGEASGFGAMVRPSGRWVWPV